MTTDKSPATIVTIEEDPEARGSNLIFRGEHHYADQFGVTITGNIESFDPHRVEWFGVLAEEEEQLDTNVEWILFPWSQIKRVIG